jgi:hypothetical protein
VVGGFGVLGGGAGAVIAAAIHTFVEELPAAA